MLRNINGEKLPDTVYGEKLENEEDLESLFESVSYEISNRKKIIGFARFNPYIKGDDRFKNRLSRNHWYAITSVKGNFIKLKNINDTHFGLFDNIIAIKGKEYKFENLKKGVPHVDKYWKRKEAEKKEIDLYLEKLYERNRLDNLEHKRKKELAKKEFGVKVKRVAILTNFINGKYNKYNFFEKLKKEPLFKRRINKDLNYRINKVEKLSTFKERGVELSKKYYKDYNDIENIEKLKELRAFIDDFDFKNKDSFKKLKNKFKTEEESKKIENILKDKLELVNKSLKKYINRFKNQ